MKTLLAAVLMAGSAVTAAAGNDAYQITIFDDVAPGEVRSVTYTFREQDCFPQFNLVSENPRLIAQITELWRKGITLSVASVSDEMESGAVRIFYSTIPCDPSGGKEEH